MIFGKRAAVGPGTTVASATLSRTTAESIRQHNPFPTATCFAENPQSDADCPTVCGDGNIDDIAAFPLECNLFHPVEAQPLCWCMAGTSIVIPQLTLMPGDEITVLLPPAPGALPELPGFPDEDSESAVNGCRYTCGDLNGDNTVD